MSLFWVDLVGVLIFLFDCFVYFLVMYGNMIWCVNVEMYFVIMNINNGDDNVVVDYDVFIMVF